MLLIGTIIFMRYIENYTYIENFNNYNADFKNIVICMGVCLYISIGEAG